MNLLVEVEIKLHTEFGRVWLKKFVVVVVFCFLGVGWVVGCSVGKVGVKSGGVIFDFVVCGFVENKAYPTLS